GCNSMTPVVVNPGPFQSIGWPGKYVANRDCLYNLTAPSGKTLKVTFLTFDLGPKKHGNCDAVDFLEVFEPRSDEQSSTIKLCGQTVPLSVYSKTFWMKMRFLSNSAEEFTGFNATITSLTEDESEYKTKGTIQSPLFPNNYPAEIMRCAWEITAPEGKHVKLTFKHFDSLIQNQTCTCDFVRVYSGNSTYAALVGKFCGNTLPTPLISISNQMLVEFQSDFSSGAKGFHAMYSTTSEQ
ncbi:predicted protein, partial [Nematostella vectensis]